METAANETVKTARYSYFIADVVFELTVRYVVRARKVGKHETVVASSAILSSPFASRMHIILFR